MISGSMSDPERTEFCGLSRPEAEAMIGQMMVLSADPLELDAAIAGQSGLKIGRRKERRPRYIAMSRVVFDARNRSAWLAVDLSGDTGGIMRLDKVGEQWDWMSRCAPWMKPLQN